jgi:NADH:ubiquinone oxidoreductase subunit K
LEQIQLYLITGIILFALGLTVVVTRRNAIVTLMGIELMLNAANLNFVAFNLADPNQLTGATASIFVIVLAAAETAVALAFIIRIWRYIKSANTDELHTLGG